MAGDVPTPPYAYIPGQNARHPEDWFDPLKADVADVAEPRLLCHSTAWRAGMIYFHAGFFWECHEVLEAVWMQTPDPSAERVMSQAMIQLANARLKLKMRKPRASLRLCEMVRGHLEACGSSDLVLGLRPADVQVWVAKTAQIAIVEIDAL